MATTTTRNKTIIFIDLFQNIIQNIYFMFNVVMCYFDNLNGLHEDIQIISDTNADPHTYKKA